MVLAYKIIVNVERNRFVCVKHVSSDIDVNLVPMDLASHLMLF